MARARPSDREQIGRAERIELVGTDVSLLAQQPRSSALLLLRPDS